MSRFGRDLSPIRDGVKCLFVWRVGRDSNVSIKVDCLQSAFSLKIPLALS